MADIGLSARLPELAVVLFEAMSEAEADATRAEIIEAMGEAVGFWFGRASVSGLDIEDLAKAFETGHATGLQKFIDAAMAAVVRRHGGPQ